MSRNVTIFLPGDYRELPNEWARPQVKATVGNLKKALRKLGLSLIHI